MSLTLVLGGTRSGKSTVAERLTAVAAGRDGAAVTYVATGAPTDDDMAARIAAHRARRPASWSTLEVTDAADLPRRITDLRGIVLLDSLGAWVAAHDDLEADGAALVGALRARTDPTVVVSEELGMALHPPTAIGRRFVDVVGTLNQAVAAAAGRTVLVVAGRILELGTGEA